MKKLSLILVMLTLSIVCGVLCGCKKKEEPKVQVTLENVVKDLHSPLVKSTNLDVVLPGIYLEKVGKIHYYSVNKLDTMVFDERVELLDIIDTAPNTVNIVMGNKLKTFANYISIEDTLNTGVIASSIIGLYTEVYNEELGQYLYSNGTKLKSITITGNPVKTNYIVGETLDTTGLVISGTNADGTLEIQPYTLSDISGFDSTTAGTKTITITIYGRVCTYNITVTDSILSANAVLIKKIDFLKLKQYNFNITVANNSIVKLVMTTDAGGITPSVLTITNLTTGNRTITMDYIVSKVTMRAFDINGNQVGLEKVVILQ